MRSFPCHRAVSADAVLIARCVCCHAQSPLSYLIACPPSTVAAAPSQQQSTTGCDSEPTGRHQETKRRKITAVAGATLSKTTSPRSTLQGTKYVCVLQSTHCKVEPQRGHRCPASRARTTENWCGRGRVELNDRGSRAVACASSNCLLHQPLRRIDGRQQPVEKVLSHGANHGSVANRSPHRSRSQNHKLVAVRELDGGQLGVG
mmetsp:Transcript_2493/g.7613  ORF Transcript_2493/g.7613 Transcript_2493/m.7613 type:complete len:204 (+) Transcript_2493:42-653(+)